MKILFHHRIRSKDGQFVHLEELLMAFRAQGHDVQLVGPEVVESGEFGADSGFVDSLRARLPNFMFELLEFAYCLAAAPRLIAAIRRHRPDFIYERFNLFFPLGAFVCRLYGIVYVLEINGPLHEERSSYGGIGLKWLSRWSQGYTWRRADLCLPVTEVLAQYLDRYRVSRSRVLVLHNGVDRTRFFVRDAQASKRSLGMDGKLVIGFVGFVRPWHRVDRLIRLLASGELPANAVLMIVGDGPAIAELKALAAELSVVDRVVFTGLVSREKIPEVLGCFDVALQPAVTGWASPLKVIEYLATGKVIVAPDQPNIRELLSHENNALLFDGEDEQAFQRALVRACNDPDLRRRLTDGAIATIDRLQLTWLDNARRIVERAQAIAAARLRR